ncbi:MAG: UPF0175 family protein [Dehalococcoidia bacterium]|nr:UPF0175 family protein [Dehalococcoidia bacterium]
MQTRKVESPEEILQLLQGSRLANRPEADRVRVALAVHLFEEGVISIGKAAELAGVPRVGFEDFLVELGIPTVHYDVPDYDADLRTVAQLERRRRES